MLTLNRTPGQMITIGEHIIIKVIRIRGQQVKLGIEAPQDVTIMRAEVDVRDAKEDAGGTD